MVVDFSRFDTVAKSMFDFISSMLKEQPSDTATPTQLHLFAVNENVKVLDEPSAQFFHHNVAKMLFCPNVLILTSRLQLHFYVDYYKKMT